VFGAVVESVVGWRFPTEMDWELKLAQMIGMEEVVAESNVGVSPQGLKT